MQTKEYTKHKIKRKDSTLVDGNTKDNEKRTNALRRRYERTTSNDELSENRKNQYTKAKKE